MSTVCTLTPIVIGSWPAIASAVVGVASAMGFTVLTPQNVPEKTPTRKRVESEVPNSEIIDEALNRGQKMRIQKDDVIIEFGRDERGICTVCVSGEKHSKAELERIGEEVTGRIVQQFAYHKLMTELKNRHYKIVDESVES